jgi:hypothetical protein
MGNINQNLLFFLYFFHQFRYCNSRIIKFNRKGEYITEWGTPTNGMRDSKFR